MVEFAIVAPLFFLMVIAAAEYFLYFFKRSLISHVMYEASRDIQTGEIQANANPATAFRDAWCPKAMGVVSCDAISFDVRSFNTLADVSFPAATFDANGKPTNFVFQPGSGDQITAMRASTPHRFVTPMMADIFQDGDAPVIIVGYSVARNEPF
jgi:Flp pilus assembly protein TadG